MRTTLDNQQQVIMSHTRCCAHSSLQQHWKQLQIMNKFTSIKSKYVTRIPRTMCTVHRVALRDQLTSLHTPHTSILRLYTCTYNPVVAGTFPSPSLALGRSQAIPKLVEHPHLVLVTLAAIARLLPGSRQDSQQIEALGILALPPSSAPDPPLHMPRLPLIRA
jgi:hypothetical protein